MNSLEYAKSLDSQDNLSEIRHLFHIPKKNNEHKLKYNTNTIGDVFYLEKRKCQP